MSRLRYNNALGTLGADLSDADTVVTFSAPPPLPTIAAGDYVTLILEPPGSDGFASDNLEVVYLTDYAAGDSTGTIQRGREDTAAAAHASGTFWTHGATAWDLIFGGGPDAAWSGDDTHDYEFLTPGLALPTGHSWFNQRGSTYTEYLKRGVIESPNAGDNDEITAVLRTAPARPFTVSAKLALAVSAPGASYPGGLLCISDATKVTAFGVNHDGGSGPSATPGLDLSVNNWSDHHTWSATQHRIVLGPAATWDGYLAIRCNGDGSNDFLISPDGRAWALFYHDASGAFLDATDIGWGTNAHNADVLTSCEWFRVR